MSSLKIHYLQHQEIDKTVWDKTIGKDARCLPYGYSWYLDVASRHSWDALVSDDYELVMPLPFNTKILGYKQIFQPLLVQQLGVFGAEISDDDYWTFISSIPASFRKIYFALNQVLTNLDTKNTGLFHTRKNLILPLQPTYTTLRTAYQKGHKSRTNKAKKQNSITESRDIDGFIQFCKLQLFEKLALSSTDWDLMERILKTIFEEQETLILVNSDKNQMVTAQSLFLIERRRIINLFSAISDEGRKSHGTHHILDTVIERFSTQDMFLDFEGSNIEGIYKFFKGFGAIEDNYMAYELDRLPWAIKRLMELRRR